MTDAKATANENFVRFAQRALGVKEDGWAGDVTENVFKARLGLGETVEAIPNAPKLSDKDEARLAGVDGRLVSIVRRAAQICPVSFMVVEGLRTAARQQELYAQGRTKPGKVVTWTLKSKHIDGKAVDLAPLVNGQIDWNDLSKFDAIARAMRQAATEAGVVIRWGADWDSDGKPREKGETDSPHFELG